mgnify:CR=1 FL=1
MRNAIALLAVLPTLALAQAGGTPGAPPPPGGPPGAGPEERWERMEKRVRLARALGLAEALDLDPSQATRMSELLNGFDARRKPVFEQLRKDMRALRDAARSSRTTTAQVDEITGRIFAARSQMLALDQEMLGTLGKDLSPERRARMALFFARFRQRMGMEILDRMEWGREGRGRMGPPGPGGPPGWDE